MGDRNTPIKFGPEWLRNLAQDRAAGNIAANQNSGASGGGNSSGASGGSASTSSGLSNTASNMNQAPKVQLAKLRYGREEMLALYDRTSEAPHELKYIDVLYQARGKPPLALNNSFEDDMRSGPPGIGGLSAGERFGIGRGANRTINQNDGRGRQRFPFVRQTSTRGGSTRTMGGPRLTSYIGGDEGEPVPLRSWSNPSTSNLPTRTSSELAEWNPNKPFRSNKRPGTSTNWRQPSRDESDEWRSSDHNRSRPSQQDKWDRDWGDRPTQEKSNQSWSSNRRTWGGDNQNDDLPEWAMDGSEACGGTFDSSGAFHGYSNDDTNLPKQESGFPLTRSHTHGSFVRSKTSSAEEGSEEWWDSEKAKKLSPKKFDTSEVKFKKLATNIPDNNSSLSSSTISKEDKQPHKPQDKPEVVMEPEKDSNTGDSYSQKTKRFTESKTFDAMMRSDINLEEANDDRSNFQSVMITSNNNLRQKHQNIVASSNINPNKANLLQILKNAKSAERDIANQQSQEEKLVEDIMDMTLNTDYMVPKPQTGNEQLMSSVASNLPTVKSSMGNTLLHMSTPSMQMKLANSMALNQGLSTNSITNMQVAGMQTGMSSAGLQMSSMQGSGMQAQNLQSAGLQNIGVTNNALNANLGLPLASPTTALSQTLGIPIPGVLPSILPNSGLQNHNLGGSNLQGNSGIPGYQSNAGLAGLSSSNVGTSSLFMGQNVNNPPPKGDISNHASQFGLQHSSSQGAFGSSVYDYGLQNQQSSTNTQNAVDRWYYEDPKKNIQGPFSSKDMFNWYRAGFFTSTLMVRRVCDTIMRPLGSYGPVPPFAPSMSMYPMSSGFESRNLNPHESVINNQQNLGLNEVINMSNISNIPENNSMDSMQFGSVGVMRNPNPNFRQQQVVDSLWSQPSPPEMLWMQQTMNSRTENRVNNLPMFFWDQQPASLASNPILPEDLPKEMKTEEQILAQLRASQNMGATPKVPHFMPEVPLPVPLPHPKPDDPYHMTPAAPNLQQLQKLIHEDTLKDYAPKPELFRKEDFRATDESITNEEEATLEVTSSKSLQQINAATESKTKQTKADAEKATKNKENNSTKNKSKKAKEEKREEVSDSKSKEEEPSKPEKRSEETSPSKNKKEEKSNKKDSLKEKKEWLKDGFTIVKTEKTSSKDKKKMEEMKAAEEAERKRREEERLVYEEERKRKQIEAIRKQQELHALQQQRQAAESVSKKAPWSAVATQSMHTTNKDGLTLTEIQRLEREKKIEQIKEQQHMMQIIAQQQAAALAREQEVQAGLGWAKKLNIPTTGPTLAEIQAEARKQASVAAAASSAQEEMLAPPPPIPTPTPWANTQNGGGFWDTPPAPVAQPVSAPKGQMSPKVDPNKAKKKIATLAVPTKKETSPAAEFDNWCNTILASWSSKIDVPTFVGFLKDIESPYEIKDYVKCYLGETKDSSDFARNFLERRSKLLRVGMVTPSDDLCSPAAAVNPRTISASEYQDAKSKGKKTKKNKMFKVDARILGFSVTAAEDRINVGDIDSA